jgi:hypothetical protein
MTDRKRLYRVTLKGMRSDTYGISYVVAENSDEAYQKVRTFIDTNDLGFKKDRELDRVELIADTYRYTDVGSILFL